MALAQGLQLNWVHSPLCCTCFFQGCPPAMTMVNFKLLKWCHLHLGLRQDSHTSSHQKTHCYLPLGHPHAGSCIEIGLFIKPCSVTIQSTHGSRTTEDQVQISDFLTRGRQLNILRVNLLISKIIIKEPDTQALGTQMS